MALTGSAVVGPALVSRNRPRGRHWPEPVVQVATTASQNCHRRIALTHALTVGLALVLLTSAVSTHAPVVAAYELRPTESHYPNETGVCKTVDIRNTLEEFKRLRPCRVIEGFLQILLFDNVNETALSELSFPQLTEITDYFLLYRVNGLRSIGQMFPNLSVIRGQNLFFSNALVVFEMSSLQEIGLHHLTNITHGSVHIDKNPSLCFVHSIDWGKIIQDGSEPFIKSLKPENECPMCPGDERGTEIDNSISTTFCRDKRFCWNRQHCQKLCPQHCPVCNDLGHCCSPLCIGGCSNEDPNQCTVCKYYSMGFGNNRKCLKACPPNYYKYLERRCVTKEECLNMTKPLEPHQYQNDLDHSYKIFNGSCILRCPTDYTDDKENHTCKPCGGRCKKYCQPVNIDSISLAKQLRSCTHITGSLEIQIRGGSNIVSELEENLSMIEEIEGYLKIARSNSLVSLNFLKSLRRIRGRYLENNKYVFSVLDNQNLQEIWDWKNRTLQIDNGSLFFHFNPKLCINKIEMLQKKAKLSKFTDLEVAPTSNGDKIACDVKDLVVNISKIKNKGIILEWKRFKIDDHRKLLGYIVYSIEAPHRNVTLYDGRDACGQDQWRVDDVPNNPYDERISHPLLNLKPYTQYAFYVKTYTIATERRGAQSKIQYFRTKPSTPTPPQRVQVTSNSSDSLRVTWAPPFNPNGNITHYIVTGKKHVEDYSDFKDRNYCKEPPQEMKPSLPAALPSPPKSNDTCSCGDSKQNKLIIDESEESARIKFEDELQNQVYVKRPKPKLADNRRKRETKFGSIFFDDLKSEAQNITENGTDIWESFSFPVYGSTEFFINKLHHFTSYDINVQACREKEGKDDDENNCSSTAINSARTQMKEGANKITKLQITNQSLDTLTIGWEQPDDPNGVIVSVIVEYKRVDIENARAYTDCVPIKDSKNDTVAYTITKLYPGNYSLRLLATSSVATPGVPEYSDYIHFHIQEPSSHIVVILVSLTLLMIVVISAAAWVIYRRQKEKHNLRLIPSVNPEYVSSVTLPAGWEVPRDNVQLIKELGQGSFGMVYEGIAKDIKGRSDVRCAVKTVNEHATNREREDFLKEASVMTDFNTAHVVRLLGVVSQGQPTLVIMELMTNGDLKSYLRSHRPDVETFNKSRSKNPPTLRRILQMALEIADGMAYLASKKYVHRDLAARNCMVSEDMTVKIGDFGMTRDIYETDYYRKGSKGLLPVRWMSPESLKDGVFTSSSDVWSYGVVLWEMATLASQPYQGLSNDQVVRYVIDGGLMERPDNCPDKLYTLMRCCWQPKPSARPTFMKLCSLLLDDATQEFTQVSFYHSPEGAESRTSRPTPSSSQDDPTTPLRATTGILGYTPSDSQESEELGLNTHHQFPSISESTGITATANGYVSGCPTNAASTQW